jgi:hypothetical protein
MQRRKESVWKIYKLPGILMSTLFSDWASRYNINKINKRTQNHLQSGYELFIPAGQCSERGGFNRKSDIANQQGTAYLLYVTIIRSENDSSRLRGEKPATNSLSSMTLTALVNYFSVCQYVTNTNGNNKRCKGELGQ